MIRKQHCMCYIRSQFFRNENIGNVNVMYSIFFISNIFISYYIDRIFPDEIFYVFKGLFIFIVPAIKNKIYIQSFSRVHNHWFVLYNFLIIGIIYKKRN